MGNEEEVDTEEVDVEKVVTTGMRRRMRRWSTRSPRKHHFFFNMFLYSSPITMRGRRRGSKENDTVMDKKDKIANTYKILFIFFLNALMWHEYEYYRNLVGLVQIFHSK